VAAGIVVPSICKVPPPAKATAGEHAVRLQVERPTLLNDCAARLGAGAEHQHAALHDRVRDRQTLDCDSPGGDHKAALAAVAECLSLRAARPVGPGNGQRRAIVQVDRQRVGVKADRPGDVDRVGGVRRCIGAAGIDRGDRVVEISPVRNSERGLGCHQHAPYFARLTRGLSPRPSPASLSPRPDPTKWGERVDEPSPSMEEPVGELAGRFAQQISYLEPGTEKA
jgi:hypothetical protein